MGLLACRGPVYAPSLVWGACGGVIDPPDSPTSQRSPRGKCSQNISGADTRRRPAYDLSYDPERSPSASLSTNRRGGSARLQDHQQKLGPSRPPLPHRFKVVHAQSHYRSEKREVLRGPQASSDSNVYSPVYFTLPGGPAATSNRAGAVGMDKWDSARVLHKSRPVAAVLRHIEEQRNRHLVGTPKRVRVAPLFDHNGLPVEATPPKHSRYTVRDRGTKELCLTDGKRGSSTSRATRSSYMYCISSGLRRGAIFRPRIGTSTGSDPRSTSYASSSCRAPRSAPALIGYKPVYVSADSSCTSLREPKSGGLYNNHGHCHRNDIEPNNTAFMISSSGREGRSHRTVAGSHRSGYGGASGRAHCRALCLSQAGYTLGWVRRRNADEHAAASKIQACFRGR